ncbi:MAG: cell division protein ZipA C-terminal FtsZ-binding domain-containing protein, partial [Gammaproteobacteria bacterium]|nr:cell division protein ZipA C-terminal FtsZ-binding domain-containing protein [Gammaproteobacteria bacterium]
RMQEPSAGEREGLAPRKIEPPLPDAAESNLDETPNDETTDVPRAADDGPEVLRKGRRIEIAGKRTEPTVPRSMRPEFHEFVPPEPKEPRSESDVPDSLDEVIVVWVFARPGRKLDGETLFKTFVSHGLKCDADRVFKKTDPRCGGPWYAVANGVEPGTFDISRPAALETPGVVLLLNLGEVRDPGPAFEDMLDIAQDLAIALDAELKDEGMSDMSAQTIEHCRQRIRDHRRMLLRA